MKNAIVFYCADGCTDEALMLNGKPFVDDLEKRCAAVDGINGVFYSVPELYDGILLKKKNCLKRKPGDVDGWISLFGAHSIDNIIKIYADSPFADPAVIAEMLAVHTDYFAEFTYSENLPDGYSCEIYSCELIKIIPQDDLAKRLPVATVVKNNINQFDVELFYKSPDIRDKRLSFRSSDTRDRIIMERIIAKNGAAVSYADCRTFIEKNPDMLYVAPSYYEIELTGKRDSFPIYSVYEKISENRGDLDLNIFNKIISGANAFGVPYSIALGGSGEPLRHARFYDAMNAALESALMQTLVIETEGVLADEGFAGFISQKNDPRVKVIIEVNGFDPESYRKIHKTDSFDKVLKNVRKLKEMLPDYKNSLYLQIMKINETESWLDRYYDFWEQEGMPLILQKQNTYLGMVEDRRYYDLTPLDRVPCWHLQRDLFVLANGKVPYCKQDVNAENGVLSLETMTVEEVWNKRRDMFMKDYRGEYPSKPDSRKCDEWYTFNL